MRKFISGRTSILFLMVAGIGAAGLMATGCNSQAESNAQSEVKGQSAAGSQMAMAENVSNEELKQFMAVNQKMQSVQMDVQKKLLKAIQDEDLEPQRYNEIARAQNNPASDADASKEEMKKMEAVGKEMQSVQQEMQKKGEEVIKGEGMEPERYQQVGMALQSKPELQERYRNMMMQEMQKSMPQGSASAPAPQGEAK